MLAGSAFDAQVEMRAEAFPTVLQGMGGRKPSPRTLRRSQSAAYQQYVVKMFQTLLTSIVVCASYIRVNQAKLLQARSKLVARIPPAAEILRGSLLHRHVRHRSGCSVCANGPSHPVWALAVSYPGGRTRQIGIRSEIVPTVQQWLENYQKLKATLEEICELNQQLLRPE